MKNDVLFFKNGIYKRLVMGLFLAVFTVFTSFAQSRQVAGKVTSGEDASAIPGANVIIKGTTTGTITDVDGGFSIAVPDNSSVLVVSYLGYVSKEVVVGEQSTINIGLTSDVKALQEVVVVGYGTQQRKDLTGSISSVSAAQIEKVPVTTIDRALQGRSAGVQVTSNDGSPGAGISVKIRGIGTFGDNSPLYVVDGYPISGGLNTLNPNDIASMDVLKDASATAIYGSRASNGVVIITTKRGKKDGIQVSFDSYASIQSAPKLVKVLNAQQFAALAVEVGDRDGYKVLPEWRDPSSLRNIDWQRELYGTGTTQSYNLALRGGSDKVQSAFSVGYYNQKGIVKFSDFKRLNASMNVDYTPKSWVKVGTSIKYSRTDGQVRFGSGVNGLELLTKLIPTMTGNPLTDQVKDENGVYGYYTKGADATSASSNVLANIEDQDRKNANNRFLTSTFLEISVFKDLKLKTNIGMNLDDYSGYYFQKSNNRGLSPTLSYYSQSANNTFEWLWENTAAYSKTFGAHSIDFVGGVSAQKNTYRQMGISGNGSISDELRNVGSIEKINNPYGNEQTWAIASQFARLTYKLFDKYIITGTVRRDGSSRFGSGNKYGVFPSVALAWRLKDESFMANVNVISDLKIRGSWGQAGNQNIGLFKYQALYDTGPSLSDNRGYVFGREKVYYAGIAPSALPNPDLTWETSTQSNVGVDASFLNGKVSLTADYYIKESSGFLLDVSVPSQTGFSKATRNVGSIKNSGLELSLGYRESQNNFKWGVSANITTVNNKIKSFADGLESVGNFSNLNFQTYNAVDGWTNFSRSQVGGNVGAFYGYAADGIFQTQDEISALNAGAVEKYGAGASYQTSKTVPGDRKFKDLNNDGRITDADRKIIGSPVPDFFGGVNFDASYKQFDFSMFWYASVGNEILNYAKRNLQSLATNGGVGLENVSEEYYLNRWTETNHTNKYTRALREDVNGSNRVSDAFVEDGSYLRLRNVQLGYTLPASLLNKASIKNVRIYISAQNLFTFTKYSGLNPEIGDNTDSDGNRSVTTSGLDIGSYPITKSYTFGLSVQF